MKRRLYYLILSVQLLAAHAAGAGAQENRVPGYRDGGGRQPASSTRVKPPARDPNREALEDLAAGLRAGGSDLSRPSVLAAHLKTFADAADGKYRGVSMPLALTAIGLLVSGDSPLSGDPGWVRFALSRTLPAATAADSEEIRAAAVFATALIAGSNYSVPASIQFFPGSTAGEISLNALSYLVLYEPAGFAARRTAAAALAALKRPEAVKFLERLAIELVERDSDKGDKVVVFDALGSDYGELQDAGDKPEALQAVLMLALREQMDGPAGAEAEKSLRHFAQLDPGGPSCRHNNFGLRLPKAKGVNKTTLLASRYLLARPPARLSSVITRTSNDYGVFEKETGSASCLIPFIEDESFSCGTRRAFNDAYKALLAPVIRDRSVRTYTAVSFDNCAAANSRRMVLKLGWTWIKGGGAASFGDLALKYLVKELEKAIKKGNSAGGGVAGEPESAIGRYRELHDGLIRGGRLPSLP